MQDDSFTMNIRQKLQLGDLTYMEARNIGYMIRDTHRSFRRIMNARIAPYGISAVMWTQLWELWHDDGLTQTELAKRVKLEKPSVNITISKMEAMGLVERRESEQDRREKRVFLTKKANSLKESLLNMTFQINEDILACLSNDETEQLLKLLYRINEAAQHVEDRTLKENLFR